MLGDSFTFGLGVEDHETFSAQMERGLQVQGWDVEVINAGVISYSPLLEYVALRDRYGELAPDLILLWFDFSDLQDDWNYVRHAIIDREGRLVACHPDWLDGHFDWWGALLRRSELAAHLRAKLLHVQQKMANAALARAKPSGAAPAQPASTLEEVAQDRYAFIRPSVDGAALEPLWTNTSRFLVNIRDLLATRGIPLVLVLYLYGVQVGPDQWAKGRVNFGFEQGRVYDDPQPFIRIEAFAAAHHIPVINTVSAFHAARNQRLFFDHDGHLTPTGHQVAAEGVLQHPVFQAVWQQIESRLGTHAIRTSVTDNRGTLRES